jgi:hypothetical protein
MKSLKPGLTQPSYEVAALGLRLKQRESNRRRIRRIEPTKTHTKHKMPKLLFFFDTEANIEHGKDETQRQTLRFGYGLFKRYYPDGKIYESEYLRFTTGAELYSILEHYSRQGKRLTCFAHNLGYDWSLTGVHNEFMAHGWGINAIQDRKRNTRIIYYKDNHKIDLIDSFNIFPMSLADIGENLGLEKGSIDFRYKDQKEADDYCKNDVYILSQAIEFWRSLLIKNNWGAMKATLAAQSLAIFKQRYLTSPILTNQGEAQKQLERRAYYGGRTEANFVGYFYGKVHNLDINSAYPSVMQYNKFPVEFVGEINKPTLKDLEVEDDKLCYFAQITLDCDKALYPYREDDRLLFPIGRFTTWLCEPELRDAIQRGYVYKIRRLFVYKARTLFTSFVNDLHRKRREAIYNDNRLLNVSYKLLLNSLYGKFGEYHKEWTPVVTNGGQPDGVQYEADLRTKEVYKTINFGGLKYEYIKKSSAAHSFPLISAFVTSYLRITMLRAMERAGSRNWLYCDSDSLYVTDAGLKNLSDLIHRDKLGRWKVEAVGINMEIRGLKDYVFADKEKIKGVSKDAKLIAPNTYKMNQWQTMHETICDDLHGSVAIKPIVKVLERHYHKGIVSDSGWIEPIVIEEFT